MPEPPAPAAAGAQLPSPVTSAHSVSEQDVDRTSSLGLLGARALVLQLHGLSSLLTSFMYQDREEGAAHTRPPLAVGALEAALIGAIS